ncbi:hypothetical protein C2E23DRAFT_736462 [Lenzites betulinus]|nr:hypothetical protein C2E23DRAFT_736462 [Lenzites betulinus]
MVAIARTPPFAPLNIISDSKFVVDGLTKHVLDWEDRGWTGVAHKELVRDVVSRLRARSARTTFTWIKGHSGVAGNEEADGLAAAGARIAPEESRCTLPMQPEGFVANGVRLAVLSQRLAYQVINTYAGPPSRRKTDLIVEQTLTALQGWQCYRTKKQLWRSIRSIEFRRGMRDFWWKMWHGAHRVGPFWENIPRYEQRAVCSSCGVTETMEHILTECSAPGQAHVWGLVRELLERRGVRDLPLAFGALMGAPALTLNGPNGQPMTGASRFARLLLTESTHLVWKLRCQRVIDDNFRPGVDHSLREIENRWWDMVNRRLLVDQVLVARRKKINGLSRSLVLKTWGPVLDDRAALPDDWILSAGVLVGRPRRRLACGDG